MKVITPSGKFLKLSVDPLQHLAQPQKIISYELYVRGKERPAKNLGKLSTSEHIHELKISIIVFGEETKNTRTYFT